MCRKTVVLLDSEWAFWVSFSRPVLWAGALSPDLLLSTLAHDQVIMRHHGGALTPILILVAFRGLEPALEKVDELGHWPRETRYSRDSSLRVCPARRWADDWVAGSRPWDLTNKGVLCGLERPRRTVYGPRRRWGCLGGQTPRSAAPTIPDRAVAE
jgi:hypothetical protein